MKRWAMLLPILLWPTLAYAADEDQYVDTSTGCGGNDGTIGNPYCSCDEWEAQNRNLVTEAKRVLVHFTGNDTGTCTISGWTMNSTNYVQLIGIHMDSTQYNPLLTISDNFVRVKDGYFKKDGAFKNIDIIKITGASSTIERTNIVNGASLSFDAGIGSINATTAPGGTNTFRNICILSPIRRGLAYNLSAGDTSNFYNITIRSAGTNAFEISVDSSSGSTINLKNNAVTGSGTDDYNLGTGLATYNHSNNVSEDTTSPDSGGRSKTLTFSDSTTCHIAAAETDLVDQGSDLSGTGFSDDIDGDSRPQGSAWDIAADEVTGVTTTTTTTTTSTSSTTTSSTTSTTTTTSSTTTSTTSTSTTTTTTSTTTTTMAPAAVLRLSNDMTGGF